MTGRLLLSAGNQTVDLNCSFLAKESWGYYCHRDMDGEELVSCEECTAYKVFVNKRKKT